MTRYQCSVFGLQIVRCYTSARFNKFLETCFVEYLVDVKIYVVPEEDHHKRI